MRHLRQTFGNAANFLYDSSFSGNTRFFISGKVFNQSLRKLVQIKSTCFKTIKLRNFMRSLSQNSAVWLRWWRHQPKIDSKKCPNSYLMVIKRSWKDNGYKNGHNGHKKIKSNSKRNFEVMHLFMKLFSQNLEILAPC